MKKAKYDNPRNSIRKPKKPRGKKTLVVLNTFIPKGVNIQYSTRDYKTHGYRAYLHDRIESLKFTLAAYKHFNAGEDYDLIIVDNESTSKRGQEYLKEIEGIPVYTRENTFFSFGGYKYAWDKFRKGYDYFLFHEMDWVPAKDGWLTDLVDYWNSDRDIGMIGNLIEQQEYSLDTTIDSAQYINKIMKIVNPERDLHYNLDSEYMFSSYDVLRRMGKWNLFRCSPENDLSPIVNELGFQQPLLEQGYSLACYNDGEHTMFYAIYNNGMPDKWNHGFNEHLAPMIPEQTRLFVPEVREYFNFYDHKKNSSFVEWLD